MDTPNSRDTKEHNIRLKHPTYTLLESIRGEWQPHGAELSQSEVVHHGLRLVARQLRRQARKEKQS